MILHHPNIKNLSIERFGADIAAHVKAGWVKDPQATETTPVEAEPVLQVEPAPEKSRK